MAWLLPRYAHLQWYRFCNSLSTSSSPGFSAFNPQNFGAFDLYFAINTAASFVTNTNWQVYSGETTVSYLTQMAGLAVQNFLSAATGICIAVAVMRGITRQSTALIGNFWVDMTRCTLYIPVLL